MGLGYAVRKRQEREEPLTGEWARAKKFVEDYVAYAYRLGSNTKKRPRPCKLLKPTCTGRRKP
jgi:hypothetical protein